MVTAKKDSNNYGSSVDEKHSENRDSGNNGSRIEVKKPASKAAGLNAIIQPMQVIM